MRIQSVVMSAFAACVLLSSAVAQTPTARVVGAANAFLATLNQAQKDSVLFLFNDEAQRKLL